MLISIGSILIQLLIDQLIHFVGRVQSSKFGVKLSEFECSIFGAKMSGLKSSTFGANLSE